MGKSNSSIIHDQPIQFTGNSSSYSVNRRLQWPRLIPVSVQRVDGICNTATIFQHKIISIAICWFIWLSDRQDKVDPEEKMKKKSSYSTLTVIFSSLKGCRIWIPSCGSYMVTWIFSASLMTFLLCSFVGTWMVSSSSLLVI